MAKAYAVAAHAFFGDYRPNWRDASAFALGSVGIGVSPGTSNCRAD